MAPQEHVAGVAEIVSAWFGQSEEPLADMFVRAREQRPCVVFFDELDALAAARQGEFRTQPSHRQNS